MILRLLLRLWLPLLWLWRLGFAWLGWDFAFAWRDATLLILAVAFAWLCFAFAFALFCVALLGFCDGVAWRCSASRGLA